MQINYGGHPYFVNTSIEGSGESAHLPVPSLLVAAIITEISSNGPYKLRQTGKIHILHGRIQRGDRGSGTP